MSQLHRNSNSENNGECRGARVARNEGVEFRAPVQGRPDLAHGALRVFDSLADEELAKSIRVPKLSEGDQKMALWEKSGDQAPRPRLYRPNVAVHFFNEFGQVLGCLRKDKKSWQCVQGGVEDFDQSGGSVTEDKKSTSRAMDADCKSGSRPPKMSESHFLFPTHSFYDEHLLHAAEREIAEEIGLDNLAAVGGEYICTISPPSRDELETLLRSQGQGLHASLHPSTIDLLSKHVRDPFRFFRYEFQGMMGMKARQKGYVGQEQHQLLFFLPSEAIKRVNLVPDRKKYGSDVSQEFRAVAWMLPSQFVPLCADFKRSMMAYVVTCDQFTKAVHTFLSKRGGIQKLERTEVLIVAPHTMIRGKRKRSPTSPAEEQ